MAKTKVIERKPLSFAEKTFIPQIVGGLKATLGTMMDKTVTLQYPEERPVIPDNYRGVPTLVKDPKVVRNVYPANYASLCARRRLFGFNLVRLTRRQNLIAHMLKRRLRNLILICCAVFIAACAKKFARRRPSSCRTFFLFLERVGNQ